MLQEVQTLKCCHRASRRRVHLSQAALTAGLGACGGKLMHGGENIAPLGNDLFGDRVNLYNGALEFVRTDLSLQGSSALPVAVGRRLTTGNVGRVQGTLAIGLDCRASAALWFAA